MSKRKPIPTPIQPGKVRVAIYARRSDDDEGRNKSRSQQIDHCLQSCEVLAWPAVPEERIYAEADGTKGHWWWRDQEDRNPGPHRPELTRLIADIEAGLIDVVLVWRTDRLYRDAGVADALLKLFVDRSVRLFARTQDYAIHTAGGFQAAMTEASANRGWRDRIGEDVARDHDDKARLGMFTRDPSVLGFRSKGRGTQAVEAQWSEIDLVNRIFRLFAIGEDQQGPVGISGICKRLMDEAVSLAVGAKGHRSKNPKRVYTSQIRTILENPMYVGRWRHDGQEYQCDRLLVQRDPADERTTAVPEWLFEAAQAKLAGLPKYGRKALSGQHVLAGIAVCGCCGRPLHVNNKRRRDGTTRRTLICSKVRDTLPCDRSGMANLFEEQVEAWVFTSLAPWLNAELEALRSAQEQSADAQRLSSMELKLREARARETDELSAAIGVLDQHQLRAVADRLRAEREALERQVRSLQTSLSDRPPALVLAPQENKALARTALGQAVSWIAVTGQGVIVLTTWGTYVGGALVSSKPAVWNSGEPRRSILPPSPASCAECVSWLPDPSRFIAGRRYVIGDRAERLTDEELLPGVLDRDMGRQCA